MYDMTAASGAVEVYSFPCLVNPGPRLLVGVGGGSGCGGYSRTVTELEFHTVSFISYIQLYSDTASSAPLYLVSLISPPLLSRLISSHGGG